MLHRKRTQTGMSVRTDSLERDASVQQVHLSFTLHSNIHVHSLVYSHIYRLLHLDHPLMDHCLLDGHFHVLDLQHQCRKADLVRHHLGVSGFAAHAVASVDSLVKIDKEIPFDIAALFGCAVLTGVGAVVNTAQLKFGDSILIVGLGGLGLSAVLGAKAAGASKIIAADLNPEKRKAALALGAHHTIDSSKEGALEVLMKLTNGGVDISVEFAGAISALDFAFQRTKRGVTTVTAALPHPDARLQLSPVMLVGQEKTLKGSYLGSCVPSRDIPAYIQLYKSGRLKVDKLISHTLHFP